MAGQLISRGANTWLVRVFRGRHPITGKRIYLNKTIHGTKKHAQLWLTRTLRELDTGTFVEPNRETLGSYLAQWLDVWAAPRVRARTLVGYRWVAGKYLVPSLGERPLALLTSADIQKAYNDMSARGLSARTVRLTHTILRSALEQAVRTRLLARNPADITERPRRVRREMRVVEPRMMAAFLAAAAADEWEALWVVLVTTGLRPGEALGLKWDDLDGTTLRVQRVLVPGYNGSSYFAEPKTAQSRRGLPLPKLAIEALARHRCRQAEQKLLAGPKYADRGLVFANPLGRPADYRTLVASHYKKVLKTARLPDLRLYDLRHSSATLLLASGVHPKVVAERLGHSSVTLTLDTYSHVLPEMQRAASEVFDSLPVFVGRATSH